MRKIFITFAALLISMSTIAETTETQDVNGTQNINEEKDLNYWAKELASRVKVRGYAQAGYTATLPEEGEKRNTFDMKRVVLMVGAEITPEFYAFFMHEFKLKDMQEYYLEYRPSKAFKLRFGQSKIEYTMENPMSPCVLESIGPMAQGVFWLCGYDPLIGNPAGRDMGLMIYGDLFNDKLGYVLEVVNGGQTNAADRDNRKNVIGKLEYKPVPNFRLSVSGQLGYGTAVADSKYNPTVNVGDIYRQNRYAAGAEWKSKKTGNDFYKNRCAMVRTEVLGGKDGDCKSFGAYVSSSIPLYKGLDLVWMADYMNYNTDLGLKKTNLMAGVQYWIFKKCRLQAQYTYSARSSAMKALEGANQSVIQTQIQVAF